MVKINSKILGIIILSTIFGLGSGLVATLLTRVYILEESFNVPLYGEINLSGSQYSGSSLVISNPKKVVVEQDAKVAETVSSAKDSIIGIFEKKKNAENQSIGSADFDTDNFYKVEDKLAQGLIITSDGWIISNFVPQELKKVSVGAEVSEKNIEKIAGEYVIITNNDKVYTVDNIIVDNRSSYSFWHINENSLPVKGFISRPEISSGKMLIGVDWDKNVVLSSVFKIHKTNDGLVRSSDDFSEEIILTEKYNEDFGDGFFFDLNGNLAALVDSDGKIIPAYTYLPCIKCLLTDRVVKYPSLGMNYINLSDLIISGTEKEIKGAMIAENSQGIAVEKDGVAQKAGFQANDIISAINGIAIDDKNDLSNLISSYAVGEKILIDFERNGEKFSVNVELGQK